MYGAVTGNIVFPGFTAPKVEWVRRNEPHIFDRIAKVLLPKDYLRLFLTGEHISEMSDAAGTSWLDTGRRDWSDELLAASHLVRWQQVAASVSQCHQVSSNGIQWKPVSSSGTKFQLVGSSESQLKEVTATGLAASGSQSRASDLSEISSSVLAPFSSNIY